MVLANPTHVCMQVPLTMMTLTVLVFLPCPLFSHSFPLSFAVHTTNHHAVKACVYVLFHSPDVGQEHLYAYMYSQGVRCMCGQGVRYMCGQGVRCMCGQGVQCMCGQGVQCMCAGLLTKTVLVTLLSPGSLSTRASAHKAGSIPFLCITIPSCLFAPGRCGCPSSLCQTSVCFSSTHRVVPVAEY